MHRPASWTQLQKLLFRFAFAYFALLLLPGTIVAQIPFSSAIGHGYDAFWRVIVLWVGKNLFHTSYELVFFGADVDNTAAGWILLFCYILLAAIATLLWSVVDRKRDNYDRLHQWFRLLLRFSLALTLIHYAALKIIPTQMIASPPLGVLMQRVGDLTPMRMLWVFMGTSPAYEVFTGCLELLGALLLLLPRTTLLGAVVCTANMLHVFVLNMCYDVPVKLYSFHLLLMSVVLLLPDLPRLANLFLNRPVEPQYNPPLFARRRLGMALQVVVLLAAAYQLTMSFSESSRRYKQFHPPTPPLYGIWSVEKFAVDGKDVPLFTEPDRWRWVIFQRPGAVSVELMIGSRRPYALQLDNNAKTMTIRKLESNPAAEASVPKSLGILSFSQPSEDALVLDGTVDGRRIHAELQAMQLRSSFHWIFVPPKEEE